MKIRVYYHNADLDGLCSAAIVYQKFGNIAEYVGVNYGDPLDLDPSFDQILFVDFSPEPHPSPLPNNLFVIDHHKTSIGLPGIIDTKRAACVLCWNHFFPTEPLPVAVGWIGQADTWQKDSTWGTHVIPFCLSLQAIWPYPADEVWPFLFDAGRIALRDMVKEGRAIKLYLASQNVRLAQAQAYTTNFVGYATAVIIGGGKGSHRLNGFYDPAVHVLQMVVERTQNRFWRYHLYTDRDDIDVSEIAKRFGGGGHQKAAGFQHQDLLV